MMTSSVQLKMVRLSLDGHATSFSSLSNNLYLPLTLNCLSILIAGVQLKMVRFSLQVSWHLLLFTIYRPVLYILHYTLLASYSELPVCFISRCSVQNGKVFTWHFFSSVSTDQINLFYLLLCLPHTLNCLFSLLNHLDMPLQPFSALYLSRPFFKSSTYPLFLESTYLSTCFLSVFQYTHTRVHYVRR